MLSVKLVAKSFIGGSCANKQVSVISRTVDDSRKGLMLGTRIGIFVKKGLTTLCIADLHTPNPMPSQQLGEGLSFYPKHMHFLTGRPAFPIHSLLSLSTLSPDSQLPINIHPIGLPMQISLSTLWSWPQAKKYKAFWQIFLFTSSSGSQDLHKRCVPACHNKHTVLLVSYGPCCWVLYVLGLPRCPWLPVQ